jgi:hypothetical protein
LKNIQKIFTKGVDNEFWEQILSAAGPSLIKKDKNI